MYHTFSEKKVSIAEWIICTLKIKCEIIKTVFYLLQKKYILTEVLPKV